MQQGDSGVSEGVKVEVVGVRSEDGDAVVDFPLDHLTRLDEQLSRPKWVVPVRHDDDLERLLQASIRLCKESTYSPLALQISYTVKTTIELLHNIYQCTSLHVYVYKSCIPIMLFSLYMYMYIICRQIVEICVSVDHNMVATYYHGVQV